MKKILVVDDDPVILLLVQSELTRAGYSVDTASSGSEAMYKLHTLPQNGVHFSAVVTDGNMPGMNGVALVKEIRLFASIAKLLVVMYTTEKSESRAEARRAGVARCFSKPEGTKPGELPKLITYLNKHLGT